MDVNRLLKVDTIREFFKIEEGEPLNEGTRALLEAMERGELDGFKLKPNEEDTVDAADVSNIENADDTAVSEYTTNTENNENTEEKEYGNGKHSKGTGSAG